MAEGIVYIPADRAQDGLLPDVSIVGNIQLALLTDTLSNRFGVWRRRASRELATRLVSDLDIVCTSIDQKVSQLSGGNQQKVLLARWLARRPSVVVLDSPTQGVDTGARESIYELIRSIAATGAAVVVISDDLAEVIGLSNRLLVMRSGALVREFAAPRGAKPDESEVIADMIATTENALL